MNALEAFARCFWAWLVVSGVNLQSIFSYIWTR